MVTPRMVARTISIATENPLTGAIIDINEGGNVLDLILFSYLLKTIDGARKKLSRFV